MGRNEEDKENAGDTLAQAGDTLAQLRDKVAVVLGEEEQLKADLKELAARKTKARASKKRAEAALAELTAAIKTARNKLGKCVKERKVAVEEFYSDPKCLNVCYECREVITGESIRNVVRGGVRNAWMVTFLIFFCTRGCGYKSDEE